MGRSIIHSHEVRTPEWKAIYPEEIVETKQTTSAEEREVVRTYRLTTRWPGESRSIGKQLSPCQSLVYAMKDSFDVS